MRYVRTYTNGASEGGHFDANGVIHLMLAALDNLRSHMIEGDWEQIADAATDEQRALLIQLGAYLEQNGSSLAR